MNKNSKIFLIPAIFLSLILTSTGFFLPIQEVDSTSRADEITDDAEDTVREIGKGLEKLGKIDSDIDSINNNDDDSTDKEELEKLYNKCVNTQVIAGLDTDVCIDPNDSNNNEDNNNDDNN